MQQLDSESITVLFKSRSFLEVEKPGSLVHVRETPVDGQKTLAINDVSEIIYPFAARRTIGEIQAQRHGQQRSKTDSRMQRPAGPLFAVGDHSVQRLGDGRSYHLSIQLMRRLYRVSLVGGWIGSGQQRIPLLAAQAPKLPTYPR